jgi:hypothetical protein
VKNRYQVYSVCVASALSLLGAVSVQAQDLVRPISEQEAMAAGLPSQAETLDRLSQAAMDLFVQNCNNGTNPNGNLPNPNPSPSPWWTPGNPGPIAGPANNNGGGLKFATGVETPGGGMGILPIGDPSPRPSTAPSSTPPNCNPGGTPYQPGYPSGNNAVTQILGEINSTIGILNNIVNLGSNAWNLIQRGQPKVTFNPTFASAMPAAVTNWMQMQDCKQVTQDFQLTAPGAKPGKPALQMVVRVVLESHCTVAGKGLYLGSISVSDAGVTVGYGTNLEVALTIPTGGIVNASNNPDSPLATALIQITYNKTSDFFSPTLNGSWELLVSADGTMKDISKSTAGGAPQVVTPY